MQPSAHFPLRAGMILHMLLPLPKCICFYTFPVLLPMKQFNDTLHVINSTFDYTEYRRDSLFLEDQTTSETREV